MNLDQFSEFPLIDQQDMLGYIDSLPGQLQNAWELGQSQELPNWQNIQQVVIAGMGGSAIGADLLSAYIRPLASIPLAIHRNYGLPAFARGPETLVIASSHSGNTEETLSGFPEAVQRGCRVLAITTGGQLLQSAQQAGVPAWTFEHHGQPRSAVGFSFGLLLAALARLGLIPDPSDELQRAIASMRQQQESLRANVPVAQNPAKRVAGQLIGRMVVVLGADILSPVARRWKGQIDENAKAWAQYEPLPEADHNTLAGTQYPEDMLNRLMALFLRAPTVHPRNQLRTELTQNMFMAKGINTNAIDAQGDTRLAHLWTALHFGDYVSYYLAMAYEVDPTPIPALVQLKAELKSRQ